MNDVRLLQNHILCCIINFWQLFFALLLLILNAKIICLSDCQTLPITLISIWKNVQLRMAMSGQLAQNLIRTLKTFPIKSFCLLIRCYSYDKFSPYDFVVSMHQFSRGRRQRIQAGSHWYHGRTPWPSHFSHLDFHSSRRSPKEHIGYEEIRDSE